MCSLRYTRGPLDGLDPSKHTGDSLLDWFREPITEFNAVFGTWDDNPASPLNLLI
jgi:hypothetical protein